MVAHGDVPWAGRVARDANALPNTCAAMPGAAGEEEAKVEEAARHDGPEEKRRAVVAVASGRRGFGGERFGMGTAWVDGLGARSRRAPQRRVRGGSSSRAW